MEQEERMGVDVGCEGRPVGWELLVRQERR